MSKRVVTAVCLLASLIVAARAAAQPAGGVADPVPVVIELYTSEGCSDCPPADKVLADLLADQPLAGIDVIALGEHVDYWNDLGWTDRFSSAAFTRRQREYRSAVFAPTPVYTPQLVIDGHLQCIGSDRATVERLIRRAAMAGKTAHVGVSVGSGDSDTLPVTVDVAMTDGAGANATMDVVVAVVANGLVTEVQRGENRGRTLSHDAVTLSLDVIGELPAGDRAATFTGRIEVPEAARTAPARVVAFVQEQPSRRIVGAATIDLSPRGTF